MSSKRQPVVLMLLFFAAASLGADPPYTFRTLAGAPPSVIPAAPLDYPYDTAVDASGNVYIADTFNDVIRKLTPGGDLTVFAGSLGTRGSSDGNGGAARFNGKAAIH